jgi:PIN domain nuclease of toxin-antitoxin system
MTILLDTCDFLWFISGDAALPDRIRKEVQNLVSKGTATAA